MAALEGATWKCLTMPHGSINICHMDCSYANANGDMVVNDDVAG